MSALLTIKDIARLAGVSQGTVSNVLNGKDNVRSEKIQKVMKVVEEYGYSVNEKAKILRKGNARILAVILPNIIDQPYILFFDSFRKYAEKHNFETDLYITNDDQEVEKKIISRICSRMTSGIVICSAATDDNNMYQNIEIPDEKIVFILRKQVFESPFIGFDYKKIGKDMAEKAVDKGYSKIGMVISNLKYQDSRHFYESFISKLHRSSPETEVVLKTVNMNEKYNNIIQLFLDDTVPEAVFTDNIALAQATDNIHKNFYRNNKLDIYTVSPVYIMPANNFIKYEVDYRLLGDKAAKYLINAKKEDRPYEKIIPSKGFRTEMPVERKKDGKTITIATMKSPTSRALKNLANLYEEYSGDAIKVIEFTTNTLYKFLDSWNPSMGYDIVRMDVEWFPWFAERVYEPLGNIDPFISREMKGFLPNVLQNYTKEKNILYAFPGTGSIQMLFYRRDLFEDLKLKRLYYEMYHENLKAPETFDEYNRIAAFFTKKYNPESPVDYGTTLMTGDLNIAGAEYLTRYFSYRHNLFNKDGKLDLQSDYAVKAMESLAESNRYAPKENMEWWTDSTHYFAAGNVAMSIQYSNHVTELVGAGSKVADKLGWAAIPGANPLLGGSVCGVSRYSENKKEALDFLKWLNSNEIAVILALFGSMPPKTEIYGNREIIDTYPWLPFVKKVIAEVDTNYYNNNFTESCEVRNVQNALGMAVLEVVKNGKSIEDALKLAETCYRQT